MSWLEAYLYAISSSITPAHFQYEAKCETFCVTMSLISQNKKSLSYPTSPTYADFRVIRHFNISHNAPYLPRQKKTA